MQRHKYARAAGYDAEQYWHDRLGRHGRSLRGPGREARSEAENIADYAAAADGFRECCREEGLDLRGAAVLDIGCANGFYAGLCRDAGVRSYSGVDITDVLFPDLAGQFRRFRFLKRDVTSDRLEGVFDVVLMIDVVEHIVTEQQLDVAMENVRRVLTSGGVFVLGMPSGKRWARWLFHVHCWREADITRRLPGFTAGGSRPFRDGRIFAFRKHAPEGPT